MFNGVLERAILEALAYSDIFDCPLRLDEIHRYLPMRAGTEQVLQALKAPNGFVGEQDDFYFLVGRENIVEIRRQREAHSQKLMRWALMYGRILGALPFIRMVALTGSLAVLNSTKDADFDYMLVTAPNRVWTARAFALLFNRITKLFGHTLCPNLIISENALAWSTHDLYSARELCQMVPITGMDVYRKLMKTNEWIKDFLPNIEQASEVSKTSEALLRNILELPLRGNLGDRIERWEMKRKIARFSQQAGFGEETVFNADVCQGNFGHHKQWTQKAFDERLQQHVVASLAKGTATPTTLSEIAHLPLRAVQGSSPIGSSQ
jgi:hypothetical protein